MAETAAGWTILIVEDQCDNINVAKTVLEYHGAEVYVARNGKDGLALLETIRPTAILLDLSMPVMNGWDMLQYLRARAEIANVPIIAVTAHAMNNDRAQVLNAGFDDYISKPYDIHDLVKRIHWAIGRKTREL